MVLLVTSCHCAPPDGGEAISREHGTHPLSVRPRLSRRLLRSAALAMTAVDGCARGQFTLTPAPSPALRERGAVAFRASSACPSQAAVPPLPPCGGSGGRGEGQQPA